MVKITENQFDMYKTNPNGLKQDKFNIANTRHLTRVITVLRNMQYATQTQIEINSCMEGYGKIKDALHFLIKHGIIEKAKLSVNQANTLGIRKNNCVFYTLTENYRNMK